MKFYILDVFAEDKYAGNQLAVIRGNPTTEEMHALTREMNYSETTFITSDLPEDGGYNTRIFTPASELQFAGHPTLGTAYVVREEIIGEPLEEIVLNEGVGQIPVEFAEDGVLWMTQKQPQFGTVFKPKKIAKILSLLPDEIDKDFPIQEVSTGLPFIMVPLKTIKAVKRAKVKVKRLQKLLAEKDTILGADALFVFCPHAEDAANDIHARCFVHLHGIPEDPATGSANGNFAAYLVKHRYYGGTSIDIRVEQGYEIQRPSLLYLRASEDDGQFEIRVGGRVQLVARGELVE